VSIDAASLRFARQRALAGFGIEGQTRLAAARVLVVGAGGLGSAVLPTLAASGIGSITIVDDDTVDESNLHRQTLYSLADVGQSKAEVATRVLNRLAPDAEITARPVRFDSGNAEPLTEDADLIVDASDNSATRYLANDAAAAAGVPLVWGNALGWTGQVGVAWDAHGVDYRDLFPTEPSADGATCATVGVLPSVCTVIGGIMASEVLKLLTQSGEPLVGRVVYFDARDGRIRELEYHRAEGSSRPPTAKATGGQEALSPLQLKTLLERDEPVVLLDVREPWEAEQAQLPGSVLIPLAELASRHIELDPTATTVIYCHLGMRSAQALSFLRQSGFVDASHLAGGIDAWSREIDPALRRY
jgi:adenylyltransferase/sulfurtransferase